MQDPTDGMREGKLDLVPMIDCIMLLLLFFILTTRFVSEDRQIAALLPADGQMTLPSTPPVVAPPPEINLVVTPGDLARGLDERGYQAAWERSQRLLGTGPRPAALRVGGSDPLPLDAAALRDPQAVQRHLDALHALVARELAAREQPGPRCAQARVTIHCFSGLSWGYALAAYDAVRAYEGRWQTGAEAASGVYDAQQRTITFAPPRVHGIGRATGQELWELYNLR